MIFLLEIFSRVQRVIRSARGKKCVSVGLVTGDAKKLHLSYTYRESRSHKRIHSRVCRER